MHASLEAYTHKVGRRKEDVAMFALAFLVFAMMSTQKKMSRNTIYDHVVADE